MVVGSVSSRGGRISVSGVPQPRLLVRRLGRELGGACGFRPLVSSGKGPLYQCQGTIGSGERSAPLCSAVDELDRRSFCGQLHCGHLSVQSRGDSFSSFEHDCAADPQVGKVSSSGSRSTVHHGQEQCPRRLSFQAQSNSGLRVDSKAGSFSRSAETLAGDDRPFRHVVESPMFTIFFALPRSECLGYGCSSSELGQLSVVCLSTLVLDTPGSEETPLIFWSADDSHCSIVASEALVPRLLDPVVDGPVMLPLSLDLLRQPHFHRHRMGISRLSLHERRLSSDLPDHRGSPHV